MSKIVMGVMVSVSIKNELVSVLVRRTAVHFMKFSFWASDYPYDESLIDRKIWVAGQMHQATSATPFYLSEVTPDGWRIVEAIVAESDAALAVAA